jgi:hypothetical protein
VSDDRLITCVPRCNRLGIEHWDPYLVGLPLTRSSLVVPDTQEKSNRWGDLKANLAKYKAANGIAAS